MGYLDLNGLSHYHTKITSYITTKLDAVKALIPTKVSQLTNDSLNNILEMCKNSVMSSNKTLKYIGLSSTQATTCTTLSNWAACESAGWTTGY